MGGDMSFTLQIFRHSKGDDLPVKVEPDEEVRILFDPDAAAGAIAESEKGATAIKVLSSDEKLTWSMPVTQEMRYEADDLLELARSHDMEAGSQHDEP
jgi:hypothetical protein